MMTINWKLRGTIFRLLAAVYAELGEEGFKGRYRSIAQFFGPDATYDSIKTFFAREIARKAEELIDGNPQHRRTGRTVSSRHAARSSHQSSSQYVEDEDLSIVAEREVELRSHHASQSASKRPRLAKSSTAAAAAEVEEPNNDTILLESTITENAVNGESADHLMTELEDELIYVAQPRQSNQEPILSDNTISLPSSSGTYQQINLQKRPCSTMEDLTEITHPTSEPPNTCPDAPVSTPVSFGYVTNRGQHRCTLCSTQFCSQEALDRHNLMSELHLRNLKNEFLVIRALANLAHATKVPNPRVHRSESPEVNSQPLTLNDSNNHHQQQEHDANHANHHSRAQTHEINDNIEKQRHQNRNQDPSSTIEVISSRCVSTSPVLPSSPPPPLHQAPQKQTSINPHSHMTLQNKGSTSPLEFSDPKGKEKGKAKEHIPNSASTSRQTLTLSTSELHEILRLTGIRLAEKCVECHPNLIAQMVGAVQRELNWKWNWQVEDVGCRYFSLILSNHVVA